MSASEPAVHAMCGIVGSGKTTIARRLAVELPALRLSRDEWMLRLYALAYDDPAYVDSLGPCTDLMWDVARDALAAGVAVVLDWNHWSRERRAEANERCVALGVALHVHFLDADVETAVARALARVDAGSHVLDEAGVRHSASILEVPGEDEGIVMVRHR